MLSKNKDQCYFCAQKGVIRLAKAVRKIGSIYDGTAFDIGLCSEHLEGFNKHEKRQSEEIREASKATAKYLRNAARDSIQDAEHKNGKDR